MAKQKQAMVGKHVGLIRQATARGAQIVSLREIFDGPYFCYVGRWWRRRAEGTA